MIPPSSSSSKTIDVSYVAIILVAGCFLFLVANALAGFYYYLRDEALKDNQGALSYGIEKARLAYPGLSDNEIQQILFENWSLKGEYHPFLQFKSAAFEGTYVNISEEGFRYISHQAAWPPSDENLNIFIFGGSTTFGSGVADDQTIASYLQEQLQKYTDHIAVYNFGVGSFFSTQERISLELLLEDGIVPDITIFIDGLNDLYDENDPTRQSSETTKTQKLVETFSASGSLRNEKIVIREIKDIFTRLPLYRLSRALLEKTGSAETRETSLSNPVDDSDENIRRTLERYLTNKHMIEAIANSFKFQTLFVWQPVPVYQYDKSRHLFYPESEAYSRITKGYEQMNTWIEGTAPLTQENFLDLSSIQKTEENILYVDAVHYSPYFNQVIAQAISDDLVKNRVTYEF